MPSSRELDVLGLDDFGPTSLASAGGRDILVASQPVAVVVNSAGSRCSRAPTGLSTMKSSALL